MRSLAPVLRSRLGAALMVTGDKQGLKGTPKNQAGAKAKLGANG
jgi:hypothetical protein